MSIRRLSVLAAALLLLFSAALIGLLTTTGPVVLPVTVDLPGAPGRIQLAGLDLGAAVVVLSLLATGFRLLELRRPSRDRRWLEYGLIAPITLFLIARVNGIEDVGALVLVYTASSAMVLFTVLQDRVHVRRGHPMLPLCFSATVGIVPWGVIAFHQVGAGIAGEEVPPIVRVVTLVMLAFAAVFAVTQWRDLRSVPTAAGAATHILLVTASTVMFAALIVLGVVLPRG